jgi:hypothetical protein
MRGARASRTTTVATGVGALTLALLGACGSGGGAGEPVPPAATRLGERLFRETRFAQHFAARVAGRALSDPLPGGDPVVDVVETPSGPIAGPYAGLSISCAACHLSDELEDVAGGGVRAYCDFATHSPLPDRGDGHATTARNAPALTDVGLPREGALFFHYDGEFETLEGLSSATLTGRSLGWLPTEGADALAHVARVVREDDGSDANAAGHGGGAYASVLSGATGLGPDGALLPEDLRLDVGSASDADVVAAVARLLARYVADLSRGPDGAGVREFRSPYDRFLRLNGLPERPDPGESDLAYARRLRAAVRALASPVFLDYGPYRTHAHPFRFDRVELRGLLVFLAEPGAPAPPLPGPGAGAGIGSCALCHAPPTFSDGRFHNIGATQSEYDAVHGLGAFLALPVPGLAARDADPDAYLPPSPAHPSAPGTFRSAPRAGDASFADLGLWNVLGNPDVPGPQTALRASVTERLGLLPSTPDDALLPRVIGWMRTPTLRDLSHSGPYFHGGHAPTLEEAVQNYRGAALSSRFGLVRNVAPEVPGIDFEVEDLLSLAAFLRALDEDPP